MISPPRMPPSTDHWPLAVRLEVLPGDSVMQKFAYAAEFGFDAVELPGRYFSEYLDELLACKKDLPVAISSISLGFRGSLLNPSARVRRRCRRDIEHLLELCADLGAIGLVMPPMLKCDTPRRLQAGADQRTCDALDKLLLSELPPLACAAQQRGVMLMLEPVNRFETDYLRTLAHAARLCEQINSPAIGVTADFFHMQLEELKPDTALRQAGPWVRHMHVADNTRVEPGAGSLNFRSSFGALHDIGYRGYIVIECRSLTGSPDVVLPRSASFLRGAISKELSKRMQISTRPFSCRSGSSASKRNGCAPPID